VFSKFTDRKNSIFLFLIVVIVFGIAGCSGKEKQEIAHPEGYVGSARCGECHDRIYHTWNGTKHRYAMAVPDNTTVVADFIRNNMLKDGKDKIAAKMSVKDGKYYISVLSDKNEMKEYEVAYIIGGSRIQRYLTEYPNGALHVLPVQWSVNAQKWTEYRSDSGEIWQKDCAKCHSTGFVENFKDGNYKSIWMDNGVSCEACHGPGARHVNAGKPEKPGTIFNPGNFHDDRRANMICGRCHSSGKSPRGYAYPETFNVGDELSLHFDETSDTNQERFFPDGTSKAHQQQFNDFRKSVMYAKGVKCWSCHHPHKASAGNSASLRLSGNILCQSCHRQNELGAGLTHSIHDNLNCISCHLPKTVSFAMKGDMAAHTFFAIPPTATRKFGNGDPEKQPNSCGLCHYHRNAPTDELIKAYEDKHKEFPTYKYAPASIVR
jgi:predicted CXXCH cytochrome family protein